MRLHGLVATPSAVSIDGGALCARLAVRRAPAPGSAAPPAARFASGVAVIAFQQG